MKHPRFLQSAFICFLSLSGLAAPRLSVFHQHVLDIASQEQITVREAAELVQRAGITGLDVIDGKEDQSPDEAFAAGLRPVTLVEFVDFAHSDDTETVDRAFRTVKEKGYERIMLVPGFVRADEDREVAWQAAKPRLAAFLKRAAAERVEVAFEDFDSDKALVGSREHIRRLLKEFPTARHVLDTGNYIYWNDDPIAATAEFLPRVSHVHIKDVGDEPVRQAVAAGSGFVPLPSILRQLAAHGYDGWYTVELYGTRREQMKADVIASAGYLKRAIESAKSNTLPAPSPDLFVGSAGLGHVSPAACYPFGAIQAGPDTSSNPTNYVADWPHTSGYQHQDGYLWRFSQNRFMGIGCGTMGHVGLLPGTGPFAGANVCAEMDKSTEVAEPGYYAVTLKDGIRCEVTALAHSAAYRFNCGKGRRVTLLVDADWGVWPPKSPTSFGRCVYDGAVCLASRTEARVHCRQLAWNEVESWAALVFSSPVVGKRLLQDSDGKNGEVWEFDFGELADGILEVRLGISSRSIGGAERNLSAEIPHFDFDGVRRVSATGWAQYLDRIRLDAATPERVRHNFEAAYYRTLVHPSDLGDVDAPAYSNMSLWDIFRACAPLQTIVAPDRSAEIVRSIVNIHERQGYLPILHAGGAENHCMVGHHAVPIVVDNILKGLVTNASEVARAYAAVKDSLTRNHVKANDATWGLLKEDWDVLDRYGYYPYDRMRGSFRGKKVVGESVSRTLECAYDDACAAKLATALGHADDAAFFSKRAANWRNVYDASSGFMRGRAADGSWRTPFDPKSCGAGPWADNDFTEGNSWQYTWHVMHDLDGLVAAMGGKSKFGERLDSLFAASSEVYGPSFVNDVSGLIGQYAHGNEPSHHVAYLYRWSDRPWRTDEMVRRICETMYSPTPDGLCGNDDSGQLAAWYVFSALGFYPVDACGGTYVLGAPQVPGATLTLPNGKMLRIVAKHFGAANDRVLDVFLNGKPLTNWKLRHADILAGGTLTFIMGNDESKRPYEIVRAGRTEDEFPPVARLEDAEGWSVDCSDAEATLMANTNRAIFGESVVRLAYRATGPDPVVRVRAPGSIAVPDGSDTVSLWVNGNNVFGNSDYDPPYEKVPCVRILANFAEDGGKETVRQPIGFVYHKDWHLLVGVVTNGAGGRASLPKGAVFTGFTITGGVNRAWQAIDLTSLSVYRDPQRPSTDRPRAKRGVQIFAGQPQGQNTGTGKLPFPTREETVIPPPVELPEKLEFRLPQDSADWNDLMFRYAGSEWVPLARDGGILPRKLPKGAKVVFRRVANSLVCDIVSPEPGIESVRFGTFGTPSNETAFISWPYYTLGYYNPVWDPAIPDGYSRNYRPRTAMLKLGGRTLFVGATFDWTQSNASVLYYPAMNDATNRLNSGVLYEPKTDGRRNGCFERFVWTFSEDVTDVLPAIPNPVSPYKDVTGACSWTVCGARDRAKDADYWRAVKAAGIDHVVINDHETEWRDDNESYTFRTESAPRKGGDAGQFAYTRTLIDELGFRYGPYNNFTDYAPVNQFWSIDHVTRRSDGQLRPGWNRCYAPKPTWSVGMCERLTPLIQQKFDFNTAYCDVHTAVAPWGRTDFDAREPGAGTFAQVFYAYGEIMLLQKRAWRGPVYSEGGIQWLYSGLTDGNYAQDSRYDFEEQPWLVDFDLKRIHPLCCNFGMGSPGMFYGRHGGDVEKRSHQEYLDRFTAATIAFGHPGFLLSRRNPDDLSDEKKTYFPVQAIAARYTQAEAREIRYGAADGSLHDVSAALANGAAKRSQLKITYSDGTVVAVNGNWTENFRVEVGGTVYDLPPNGWRAETADKSVVSFNGFENGRRVRYSFSPEYRWREEE